MMFCADSPSRDHFNIIFFYNFIFSILAEDRADALIQDLISSTKVSKSPLEILKEMEAERKEMEEQFTIRAGEAEKLREQEVLRKYTFDKRCSTNIKPLVF